MKLKPLRQSLNSKGQSLVVFVVLLPVLLLFMAFIFELGNITYLKNKYENEIKSTIEYGLKHQEDENLESKLNRLLDENLEGNKEINITESSIEIHIAHNPNGIYSELFKQKFEIDLTYIGQFATGQIIKE